MGLKSIRMRYVRSKVQTYSVEPGGPKRESFDLVLIAVPAGEPL